MRRRLAVVALALFGCSAASGPRLVVHLVLPDSPNAADAGVTSLRIDVVWDGGDAGLTEAFLDGGFDLPLPATPVDVVVTGLDGTGDAGWRGIARGVQVPAMASGSPAVATVFFGRIGAFSSFDSVAAMPPLAGSAVASWPDGRVVISGGQLADGGLSSGVWAYDPRTVQVAQLGRSLEPRAHHLALALSGPGGLPMVLLAGGDAEGGGVTASVELFWSDGGKILTSLSAAQREPSGAIADDGRLLIGCGSPASGALDSYFPEQVPADDSNGTEVSAQLLAGTTCGLGQVTWLQPLGAFSVGDGSDGGLFAVKPLGLAVAPFAETSSERSSFGAVAVGGTILQFGGLVNGVPVTFCEVDADAGLPGAECTPLNDPRADFGWVQLPDGQVLVIGGLGATGVALPYAELFDPQNPAKQASVVGSLSRPRIHPAVADISGYGAALVVSGETADGGPVGGLEIYTY